MIRQFKIVTENGYLDFTHDFLTHKHAKYVSIPKTYICRVTNFCFQIQKIKIK